jgi:hypothetical protein
MSELRLKAQEQETTLKSQIQVLEVLKKSTTDMHNLIQGLINFSQVYPPLNWSVVQVNLCCWRLVACWFGLMLTWCILHNCTGWTIPWMWCELYGSEKCFVLLSDYVLAISSSQNNIQCPAKCNMGWSKKSNMGQGPEKALWIMPKIKCPSIMQYGPSSLDC